jgi:hypothetical protein
VDTGVFSAESLPFCRIAADYNNKKRRICPFSVEFSYKDETDVVHRREFESSEAAYRYRFSLHRMPGLVHGPSIMLVKQMGEMVRD